MGDNNRNDRQQVLRRCSFRGTITRFLSWTAAYEREQASQRSTLVGKMTFDREHPTSFDEKGVKLFLSSPMDQEWKSKLIKHFGINEACGLLIIRKNLSGKEYFLDGEVKLVEEPLLAYVGLPHAEIERIMCMINRAGNRAEFELMIEDSGLPLPNPLSGEVHLGCIDISQENTFAVVGMSVTYYKA